MIQERYHPKMIIYDVNTTFDIYEGESDQRYLGWLRADYDRPRIKPIFAAIDPTEKYKMLSMMYRYNSKFMQNITDFVHPIFGIEGDGFLPLKGDMDTLKIREKQEDSIVRQVDSIKMNFIDKLIDETAGVELVFVASPSWYEPDESDYLPVKELCEKRNVRFLDYSDNEKYVHQNEWFKDGLHLNARGADKFTRDLINDLILIK